MSSEDTPYWKLVQYPLSGGKGAITRWREKCRQYDGSADLEFETIAKNLAAMKNEKSWGMPDFRWMTNLDDIGEFRFRNADKVPLRVFGFFRPAEQEFVMLIGAVEDRKTYDPADALKTARSRRDDIVKGYETPVPFSFEDDENDENDDDAEYIRQLFDF